MPTETEHDLVVEKKQLGADDDVALTLRSPAGAQLPASEPGARTSFVVELARTGTTLTVPAGQSILDVVEASGVPVLSSCHEGTCGTCETAVLSGAPEHRDSVLSAAEQAANDVMMICVSRSRSPRLVLDL